VDILLLKLTITPVVIALASLAARRFGPAFGGWLIGLPVTAAPVVLFIALDHGPRFATRVAHGFVAGVLGQIAFVLAYVQLSRRGHGLLGALAGGVTAFAAAGLLFGLPRISLALLAPFTFAALLIALRIVPSHAGSPSTRGSRADLLLRMVLATALVLGITTFASTLGPTLSGIAAGFPLLSTLLAVFAYRADGPGAAVSVYRGLLLGLFALMGFALTLALVLEHLSTAAAFTVALAVTFAIQLGSLRVVRRGVSLQLP
jgi:hypothetical protein